MEFLTFEQWDNNIWLMVSPIYHQAFADKGAKPDKIIRNMFRKRLVFLHIGFVEGQVSAMAITGKLPKAESLLIDYLAVAVGQQGRGLGLQMLNFIEDWARNSGNYHNLIIEVEAENTEENRARITFWKKCGFIITNYIHQYIWVPEPYQAMYKKLQSETELSTDGRSLFTYIGEFHKESFRK